MLAVTGARRVLAAGFCFVGLAMALRTLGHDSDRRGQITSAVFYFCGEMLAGRQTGLLGLIALTGCTVKNAWKNDVFFSWSYFLGCLALPFSALAGFCFLLADMVLQSTDAISGFPVCL